MMKMGKKLENSEPKSKYYLCLNLLFSEFESLKLLMPRKRKIIISSDEDEKVLPARQNRKKSTTNENVGYVTRGLLGQLNRDVSQVSTVIVSEDEEKENIPKPLFQKASVIDEFESSAEFAPICASTQKDSLKTPSTVPKAEKNIRKLKIDLVSSDDEQPAKKSSGKKKKRQKKMTLSSSDEETSDDKKDKNNGPGKCEKESLPKPDISEPKKNVDEELEENLSEEDLSHNTPGELPRPKQSQFKSPLDTSISNRLYVEDCESPVCTKDRKFMQTPIRVVHKKSTTPIVRFVNNEERPKGRYYPKVEAGSPPKPRKPNPVDEGNGVSVAPLARVKWCPPRLLKRGERGDSIVTSNIEYQRSPGQGLRKVSGRQIVRFVQKEKINSEVILGNSNEQTDKSEEAETEN